MFMQCKNTFDITTHTICTSPSPKTTLLEELHWALYPVILKLSSFHWRLSNSLSLTYHSVLLGASLISPLLSCEYFCVDSWLLLHLHSLCVDSFYIPCTSTNRQFQVQFYPVQLKHDDYDDVDIESGLGEEIF